MPTTENKTDKKIDMLEFIYEFQQSIYPPQQIHDLYVSKSVVLKQFCLENNIPYEDIPMSAETLYATA